MSPTLVDLRPNRHLLDHNFEGYKLNLQSLPHYSCDLDCRVDRLYPDDAQYSFVHAKLFALHNHLVLDHWDYSFNYYYIDNNRQVRHVAFENTSHTFQNKVVYDVPVSVERKSGHFNLSLSFPSSEMALIGDGTGYLHILQTGPRNRPGGNLTWENINSFLVLGEDKYFDIVDSRVQEKDSTLILHCLVQSVEHNYIHFKSVLSWVTYTFSGKVWKQTSFRRIEGKGIIHYAALETKCGALYIASDNGFEFTADSEKDKEIEEPLIRIMQRKLLYTWHQSQEDLCITLKLEPHFNRDYFQCEVDLYSIKVTYAGKDIIDGKLMARVDAELTTWNIQDNGQVDILITKYEANMWDDLLEYMDERGEQIMDPVMLEATHQRLAHLCSEVEETADQPLPGLPTQQLEECDAPSDEDTVLGNNDFKRNIFVFHNMICLYLHFKFYFQCALMYRPTKSLIEFHSVCTNISLVSK